MSTSCAAPRALEPLFEPQQRRRAVLAQIDQAQLQGNRQILDRKQLNALGKSPAMRGIDNRGAGARRDEGQHRGLVGRFMNHTRLDSTSAELCEQRIVESGTPGALEQNQRLSGKLGQPDPLTGGKRRTAWHGKTDL